MGLISALIQNLTPIFLVTSPLTSYADQILSIRRTRTSAGFSLDIPLIMLSASLLKISYWPGTHFDPALLIQAMIMIIVQLLLLKVALDNRPPRRSDLSGRGLPHGDGGEKSGPDAATWMPGGFWRWRAQRPYWQFVGLLALGLLAGHVVVRPGPGRGQGYTGVLGAVGLAIEATLPLPQLWSNWRGRSCRGFRVSVLANWLVGDAMKMSYFFLQGNGAVTWPFKACGIFQAVCDVGLGLQYAMYGDGEGTGTGMDDRVLEKGGR